ncbi:MAG: GDP-L-fucose synthase [Planctomycetota bacterium]
MSRPLDRAAPICVTGHRGLVGSAIVRRLKKAGFTELVTATRHEVDLRDPHAVSEWFARTRPVYVVHVAGLVGGIMANKTRQADFLYDNTLIHSTVIKAAHDVGVEKLLYLGSSCIYPRECPQPIREDYLLTGPLESTNYGYAIAKLCGLLACQAYRDQYGDNFISAMPTNLYGPGDNFDLAGSHVAPALIRKFHEAKATGRDEVVVWGTGTPRRELLHVDDLADACLFLLENYSSGQTINIGTGQDATIAELAETVRDIVHPSARITFDTSKPDGTPRKVLDVSRLNALGWRATRTLGEGLGETYAWCLTHEADGWAGDSVRAAG